MYVREHDIDKGKAFILIVNDKKSYFKSLIRPLDLIPFSGVVFEDRR